MHFGSKYVYLGNEKEDVEEVKVSEVDDVVLSDSDVSDDDGETCLLDILDTAGQEEYSSLKDQYVRSGNGFVIIYSITDKSSFTEAEAIFRWLKRLKDEDCYAILVANKQDLKDQAEVSPEEGKDLAKSLGIPFFETSALDGSGVVGAMKGLIRIIPRIGNDYKVVMLGSGAVGKSCITIRFVSNTFIDDYDPTIEDSYRKMINVDGLTAASKDVRKGAKKARKAKKKGSRQPDLVFPQMMQDLPNRSQSAAHGPRRGGGKLNSMYNGLRGMMPRARSARQGQQLQQQQVPQQQQQLPQMQQQQLTQQQQQYQQYQQLLQHAPMMMNASTSNSSVQPPPPPHPSTNAFGGLPVPDPPGPPPKVKTERKTDSNVVLISLSSLEDEPKLVTGDPVQCKKCEAVLTEISKLESEGDKKIWNCEFCGHKNCDIDIGEEEIPKGAILDYMLSPATEPSSSAEEEMDAATSDDPKKEKTTPGVIVYCMDISSSMQAACAVPESQSSWRQERLGIADSNSVSRLNCIQLAVERLTEQMKIDQPEKQIMLLVFSSTVSVKAGGAMDILPQFNQIDKSSFDQLLVMGNGLCESYPLKPMEESYDEFVEAVKSLRTTGCTALGPALSIATGFVSKIPGSEIVLCTDGEPNVGVGSSSGGNTMKFYEKVGKYARSKNVTINILAVEGASCDLQSVSAAAEQSGGTTNKLNPAELVRQLRQIAQNEVVATSVTVRFFLHPNFVFDEPEYGDNLSQLEKEVGSARKETDLTFRFKVRDPSKKVDIDTVPFQVQITYTKKNGMKCFRILSQRNEVTQSRQQMEDNISATVMSVSTMKTTAHLAKQGKGKEAQHMLKNVKRMVTRGAKSEEQREAKLAFNNEIEAWDDQLTYNHAEFSEGPGRQSDSAHNMYQQAQVMSCQKAGVGASKISMAMKRKKMDTKAKQAYYSYKNDMM